jgi:SAM-dependent methyltransferase
MASVAEHYDRVLADHYAAMIGDFESAAAVETALFTGIGLGDGSGSAAIDLGCGTGLQSVPLARLGWRVTGIDSSAKLLAELEQRRGDLPIAIIQGELLDTLHVWPSPVAAILCMGDTLTHLPSREAVGALFRRAADLLLRDGTLVLGWRDLSQPLEDCRRFIPVLREPGRIATCVLEFDDPDSVRVTDLIHVREGAGWTQHCSSYRKLRLPESWVEAELRAAGLEIEIARQHRRMNVMLARRRP